MRLDAYQLYNFVEYIRYSKVRLSKIRKILDSSSLITRKTISCHSDIIGYNSLKYWLGEPGNSIAIETFRWSSRSVMAQIYFRNVIDREVMPITARDIVINVTVKRSSLPQIRNWTSE